jgi:hypothetical protein
MRNALLYKSNTIFKEGVFQIDLVSNKDYFSPLKEHIVCRICRNILKNPHDCEECFDTYCLDCFDTVIYCPGINKCKTSQTKKKQSSNIIKNLLEEIVFKCYCGEELKYFYFLEHQGTCEKFIQNFLDKNSNQSINFIKYKESNNVNINISIPHILRETQKDSRRVDRETNRLKNEISSNIEDMFKTLVPKKKEKIKKNNQLSPKEIEIEKANAFMVSKILEDQQDSSINLNNNQLFEKINIELQEKLQEFENKLINSQSEIIGKVNKVFDHVKTKDKSSKQNPSSVQKHSLERATSFTIANKEKDFQEYSKSDKNNQVNKINNQFQENLQDFYNKSVNSQSQIVLEINKLFDLFKDIKENLNEIKNDQKNNSADVEKLIKSYQIKEKLEYNFNTITNLIKENFKDLRELKNKEMIKNQVQMRRHKSNDGNNTEKIEDYENEHFISKVLEKLDSIEASTKQVQNIEKNENQKESSFLRLAIITQISEFIESRKLSKNIEYTDKFHKDILNEKIPHSDLTNLKESEFFLLGIKKDNSSNKRDNEKNESSFMSSHEIHLFIQASKINEHNYSKCSDNLDKLKFFNDNIIHKLDYLINSSDKNSTKHEEKIKYIFQETLNSMFSLKYCTSCEKVDYFYGFAKCEFCSNDYCKNCLLICKFCKKIACRKCLMCEGGCSNLCCTECKVDCVKCTKNAAISPRVSLSKKKKYCPSCTTTCKLCKKSYCSECLAICFICNSSICQDCSRTCNVCNISSCTTCGTSNDFILCFTCKSYSCINCVEICKICDFEVCKHCIVKCSNCNVIGCVKNIIKCSSCGLNYCNKCSIGLKHIFCSSCSSNFCASCINLNVKTCKTCKDVFCSKCYLNCRKCKKSFCSKCKIRCENCKDIMCDECKYVCSCEKYSFCETCLFSIKPICLHDCELFINDLPQFTTLKTRSKLILPKANFEAKFYLEIMKSKSFMIGVTDNPTYEQDSPFFIDNIWVFKPTTGEKYSTEKGTENYINTIAKEGDFIIVSYIDGDIFFRINYDFNPSAYKIDPKLLIKKDLYFYLENDSSLDKIKILFVYIRKI